MTTLTRTLALTVVACLAATPAFAVKGHDPFCDIHPLPKLGFASYNLHGVGEHVTSVRWDSLAYEIGLQPHDIILSLNGYALSYDGAWDDALRRAINQGGLLHLDIRDRNTGRVVHRDVHLGSDRGPVTVKSRVVRRHVVAKPRYHAGPITLKSNSGQPKVVVTKPKTHLFKFKSAKP